MVRVAANPYVEFRRVKYRGTLGQIFLATKVEFKVPSLACNVYVGNLERSLGTEEQVVHS